jgi:hypothetical protein
MFDSVEFAEYSAEFGLPTLQSTCSQAPRVGIRDLPLDKELLDYLFTEAKLLHALGQPEDSELEEATVCLAKSGKAVEGSPSRRALPKGPKQKPNRSVRREIQTPSPTLPTPPTSHLYLTYLHGPFFLLREAPSSRWTRRAIEWRTINLASSLRSLEEKCPTRRQTRLLRNRYVLCSCIL